MKAETADYLAKARATLADAQKIAAIPLPNIAAREAYLAVLHASEAYIFEHTSNATKSHRGVIKEFNRLARAEPRIGRDLRRCLSVQAPRRLWRWSQCHADYPCRSDCCACNGAALHRHHCASPSTRLDTSVRSARAAVSSLQNDTKGRMFTLPVHF